MLLEQTIVAWLVLQRMGSFMKEKDQICHCEASIHFCHVNARVDVTVAS